MEPIIVKDLWLKFRIQFREQQVTTRDFMLQSVRNAMGSLIRGRLPNSSPLTDYWALRGVSLTIEAGEVVGIIGPNGAGKSTLLKVLSGIYSPNKGSVQTNGRIGTLLSLAAGFNNELTGRENIVLSGICMGFSKKEIIEKEQSIVDLSDLGGFIDAPLKTYSNGMRARLGFAISVNIDPDILLIDEVLQAGDISFRRKSGNILQKFRDQHKTIVVVTHSMELVEKACTRAIFLSDGEVTGDGETKEVIEHYVALQSEKT